MVDKSNAEEVALEIEFQGHSIAVKGPAGNAARFVQGLASSTTDPPASPARPRSGYSEDFEIAPAATKSSAPRPSSAPEPARRLETRAEIEASFSPCPPSVLSLASRLSSTSKFSGADRIKRAYLAGQWAGAKIQERVQSPNRTPTIELANRTYVVLRSSRSSSPRIFSTSKSFFAEVGDLSNPVNVCHGFASEAEARAYVLGAGETYPL